MPLLAIVAYARVLSFWFVNDDFILLTFNQTRRALGEFLNWNPGFYRPLSSLLSWHLGLFLFGNNALPYHALSLALHALVAWMLSRVVATISGEARTGWLAGAIFAVYPLSTEPVAWVSAQWDEWAAVCILGAIWGFSAAWRRGSRTPYILGLISSALALLMKESALPLSLVLPAVAVATQLSPPVYDQTVAPQGAKEWLALVRKALIRSLPYFIPTLAYAVALLLGGFNGYPGPNTDYQHHIWDWLTSAELRMLMPLNASVFPRTLLQLTGLLMSLGMLVGLALWGRRRWALLLLAATWFLVFLVPVINLQSFDPEVINNRVYYIALMGFCLGVATILSGVLDSPARRKVAVPLVAAGLLFTIPFTWLQLQPWDQSSHMTRTILTELGETLPPVPGRTIRLDVKDLPTMYKGSFVFLLGLSPAMDIFNRQKTQVVSVGQSQFNPAELSQPPPGRGGYFQVGFSFNPKDQLSHISTLAGISAALPPPKGDQAWDYSACRQGQSLTWRPEEGSFGCITDPVEPPKTGAKYARFDPSSPDGKLTLSGINLDLSTTKWVRLAVCARFPAAEKDRLGEWFWLADGQSGWSQQSSHAFFLNSTGVWRVYWTYLPADQVGKHLDALRFDPINDKSAVDIQWIALDLLR